MVLITILVNIYVLFINIVEREGRRAVNQMKTTNEMMSEWNLNEKKGKRKRREKKVTIRSWLKG